MVKTFCNWSLGLLVASAACTTAFADDREGVVQLRRAATDGVVRISDQTASSPIVRGQSCDDGCVPGCDTGCDSGYYGGCTSSYGSEVIYENPLFPHGEIFGNNALARFLKGQNMRYHARNQMQSEILHQAVKEDCDEKARWARCKFGYFVPTGGNGHGVPPVGHYGMVYPVDPSYFDSRDGQVYAAAGYGGPVSVPLAPVVNHTYNYGWGIPSSRLTPVLHPPTQAPVAITPSPMPAAPIAR